MSRRTGRHAAKARHPRSDARGPRAAVQGVCLALFATVLIVFGRSLSFGFVAYDDPANVMENPFVRGGLTLEGLRHAFTHTLVNSWVPLTALSHMLDCQLFGLNAAGHHLTNVLLHAVNALLLFLLLRRTTGSLWRSAGVAALFAVHPLRAESVAWISERKDVLSGLFFLLTLRAYVDWTRGAGRWWPVPGCLVLGLLSKAMLLTTPFVLLLLDHWPLRRREHLPWRRLVMEKTLLFLLCAAAAAAQFIASRDAIAVTELHPFAARTANAVVSCVTYLGQFCWPANLCAFYPYPRHGTATLLVLGSAVLLAAVTVAAILWRNRFPWLFTGWFWQLVMLAPVLGLIQVGDAARADRYTYLPHIGIAIIVVWSIGTWCADHATRKMMTGTAAALVLASLSIAAFRQTGFWKDTETLWQRALACTTHNDTAHYNLGTLRLQQARLDDAMTHLQKALAANPSHATAHLNLGKALLEKKEPARALTHSRRAAELRPDLPQTHFNLGVVLEELGRTEEAAAAYEQTLRLDPGNARAHFSLAALLLNQGRHPDALTHSLKALESDPDHANANILAAWLMATSPVAALRNGMKASTLALRANELTKSGDPVALRTLAAAQAEAGQFDDAQQSAQRALDLAITQGREQLAGNLRRELGLYRDRQPLRENAEAASAKEMQD